MRYILRNLLLVSGLTVLVGSMFWHAQAETLLRASVNYADMVPQDLFGAWERTRHIEKSNMSDIEGTTEAGNWVIFRNGQNIVLQNPETGAETEVQVESVFNDTAVFKYSRKLSQGRWCQEQLTLKPSDDGRQLNGYQIKECYQSTSTQQDKPYFSAFARVNGLRHESLPPIR